MCYIVGSINVMQRKLSMLHETLGELINNKDSYKIGDSIDIGGGCSLVLVKAQEDIPEKSPAKIVTSQTTNIVITVADRDFGPNESTINFSESISGTQSLTECIAILPKGVILRASINIQNRLELSVPAGQYLKSGDKIIIIGSKYCNVRKETANTQNVSMFSIEAIPTGSKGWVIQRL